MFKTRRLSQVVSSALIVSMTCAFALPLRSAHAAAGEFEYPELMVTPRASDRIQMEAKREASSRWTRHLPLQASALTTLTAGVLQLGNADPSKDPNNYSGLVGMGVGGGWLLTSFLMSAFYEPYSSASEELQGMAKGTQREQLVRERIAEERIEAAARTGRRLAWISALTNAGAGIYMVSKADGDTISPALDLAAVVMAAAPLVFKYSWQHVANEQNSYKKRIYAPVASGGLMLEPGTGKPAMGVALTMGF